MNKQTLIKKIVARLIVELEGYTRAAQTAHADATHEQNKAENKYDTRGLESSYLVHGQVRQVMEMEAAIAAMEKMDIRRLGAQDPIGVGALVELEQDGRRTFYFVCSRAGGMEVTHEKKAVLVITPQSPLGGQLQGKKQGDRVELSMAGALNQYRVAAVE